MAAEYDPEWVAFAKAMGTPDLPTELAPRVEAFNSALIQAAQQLPSTLPGIETSDEQITPEVKVRIYHPPGSGDKKLPCIVFCHGGGWLSGNLDTEDHICRTVCGEVNCIIVSVLYRLFPFVKFPIPIEDCYTAYQWAYSHAFTLGADSSRFLIWGGSAGGALAVAVAYKLVRSGQKDRIHGLIAMAPCCLHPDACPERYKGLHRSYIENGGADVPIVRWEDCVYAYAAQDALPPYDNQKSEWFPLSIGPEAMKGMPPTYIINTSLEAMRDDGTVLEAELKDAGVNVKRDVLHGLPHYFWSFPIEKAGALFRGTLLNGIKWVLQAQN